jgi:hypothetical protein
MAIWMRVRAWRVDIDSTVVKSPPAVQQGVTGLLRERRVAAW